MTEQWVWGILKKRNIAKSCKRWEAVESHNRLPFKITEHKDENEEEEEQEEELSKARKQWRNVDSLGTLQINWNNI